MKPEGNRFSLVRWWSVVLKEFLQLRRDRVTFAMMIGIPIMQLILFGFAINADPRHLLTGVIAADQSEFTRSFLASMRNSDYFDLATTLTDETAGREALAKGQLQFVVSIPPDFTRKLVRGEKPSLLVEADATDPAATGLAVASLSQLVQGVVSKDMKGALSSLAGGAGTNGAAPPFDVRIHKLYNPEGITQYNIIPGLMGTILTMTMVMMTGLAMTRERERGTMENLLATPVHPLEVMTGKIVPYIFIGLVQVTIILLMAFFVFHVPFVGSVWMVYVSALLFIVASLTVGITLSSLAQNQLQATQLTFFYFLPNILLSGFMFPFVGMPKWAQVIGNLLPMTYFNRLTRGILLKGNGWFELWPSIWPLMVFTVVVLGVALRFYRKTLD
ncbi:MULTISPECIES: ABC transporter permease [Ralstonia]|jgi:ABC-2 type transport system permease protein|uniref:Multidrug ABC transporter permease YbhS n=2 Tax=Pseudomonadota TaxID=1224 RepID=A0ABN9J8R2_9RALS|nr:MULTISPECIES: ABC transporter permease [Ralstonia]MBB0024152.1 ABC transporter permease [Ralstonia pickettii]MBB0034972.1 ABC transporter permease [Ralstonia pickettii]MBB0097324.1 ABC transporter permease [Ralstonia pickettii]MBB0107120.1 ABC transporter permease [Ralstonia pickettii]MBB0128097.1 ABC transporter permease [Ralstonia pickettii]